MNHKWVTNYNAIQNVSHRTKLIAFLGFTTQPYFSAREGKNIVEVNYINPWHLGQDYGCDLYAKIYGKSHPLFYSDESEL